MASLMSASRRSEHLSLALDEMAKAKRKAGTTLLRWKPDWEAAARHYREACKAYKLSGDTNGTIQGQHSTDGRGKGSETNGQEERDLTGWRDCTFNMPVGSVL